MADINDPITLDTSRDLLLTGLTGQGKNLTLQRVAEKYSSDDRYQLWIADPKATP